MYTYSPIEDCYATKKKIIIFRNEIASLRNTKKTINILDFGCGNANDFGKYFFNDVDHYLGYDIHSDSIDFAKNKFSNKNIKFTTKIPKTLFDVIMISEVLEHLEDPLKVLIILNGLLKEDGIILASTPNGFGLTEIEKFIIHKFGIYKMAKKFYRFIKKKKNNLLIQNQIPFNYESGHIQFFTFAKLKSIISEASLKLVFIKNGSIMGADLSGSTFLKFDFTKKINTFFADYLPTSLSATWIFKLQKYD
tara:strand:+ start:738 stop:1487 length:750 start_codon:yes stop_codon:yes gene_type:complete